MRGHMTPAGGCSQPFSESCSGIPAGAASRHCDVRRLVGLGAQASPVDGEGGTWSQRELSLIPEQVAERADPARSAGAAPWGADPLPRRDVEGRLVGSATVARPLRHSWLCGLKALTCTLRCLSTLVSRPVEPVHTQFMPLSPSGRQCSPRAEVGGDAPGSAGSREPLSGCCCRPALPSGPLSPTQNQTTRFLWGGAALEPPPNGNICRHVRTEASWRVSPRW